jgi:S-layer homology domain
VPSSSNFLFSVAGASSNDIYAVGDYEQTYNQDRTLVEHWDGSAWTTVTSENPSSENNDLRGVAAISSSDVWAVGVVAGNTADRTLAEHLNPCATTATPTPTPTLTPVPTSCSIQFSDVPPGSTFYDYIHCLACRSIINGYPDGTFKPNANVTRGQLSKIVSNAAGFGDSQATQMFQDVPVGSTYQVYIGRLASRGYIGGYACGGAGEQCVPPANLPYFRPNANATRGQISKIDSNAAGFSDTPGGQQFEDVPVGSTYYTYTYRLVSRTIMSGYQCGTAPAGSCVPPGNLPYFEPNNNATRGQTSKIVGNTFFPSCTTLAMPNY